MKISALKAYPNLLGGLAPQVFLRDYWQKKPLLIRRAIPGFGGELDRDELLALCRSDELESRYISGQHQLWRLEHGPFTSAQIKRWKTPWTLLVQGVNLVLPAGDQLLRAFNFIPYARLDDLMVSYATDGGGVGQHLDNYDVFLLQGNGRRRWRIGKADDQRFMPDQPLRILQNFKPQDEYLLEAGDMLYLPPQWAHEGVAMGECMTWSIGFRAPPAQELVDQFLSFLQENLQLDGRYQDPDLRWQKHPAEISAAMVDQVENMLAKVHWDKKLIRKFLGQVLTEPKPHVVFDPPRRPMSHTKFRVALTAKILQLDPQTQLLFSDQQFFLNGESESVPRLARKMIRQLADQRSLQPGTEITDEVATILYRWYTYGYLNFARRS